VGPEEETPVARVKPTVDIRSQNSSSYHFEKKIVETNECEDPSLIWSPIDQPLVPKS
jgi:hypothetical protein